MSKKLKGMPKIRRDLARKLWDRFYLDKQPAEFKLGQFVQPITSVDDTLKTPFLWDEGGIVISGLNSRTVLTVPKTYRYWLHMIEVRLVSGIWTFSEVRIYDPLTTEIIRLPGVSAGSTTFIHEFNSPTPIDQDWEIRVWIDAYTSSGNIDVTCLALKDRLEYQ